MRSGEQTPKKKAVKGTVQIRECHGRLQFRFSYGGNRYVWSLGLPDNATTRKAAETKKNQIELDIASGNFDTTGKKYKLAASLSTDEKILDIRPKPRPKLSELWKSYSETRQSGKSPATVRMYGWVANHLNQCPYKSADDAQAIFDWLNANVPSDSTRRVLMHLSACCRWARKTGLLDMPNPFEEMPSLVKVKKSGSEEDEVNPFTREERDRIIVAFKTNRYTNLNLN